MTNPDNAGGLPLLQFAVFDEFGKGADDRVWDYGRLCFEAGRELCRAAPAVSGEVEDWMVELFDEVYEREWNRAADEADDRHKAIIGPADRHATREAIAAILRKLQQGADRG